MSARDRTQEQSRARTSVTQRARPSFEPRSFASPSNHAELPARTSESPDPYESQFEEQSVGFSFGDLASIPSSLSSAGEHEPSGANRVQQHYARKNVLESAQRHYDDGWGERYGITDDETLMGEVPKSVRGGGEIDLGWFDGPEDDQDPEDRRWEKWCNIAYKNDKYEEETTAIYHCGPTGPRNWYDWEEAD